MVSQIFSEVSKKYDFMNDIMTLGLHRIWKEILIDKLVLKNNDIVLDLASGSGDIMNLIKKKFSVDVIGYDSNLDMLFQSKKKNPGNILICGKSENLPFKSNFFDAIIVSFGLRNFSDLEESLREINRVLKKKAQFLCLEFSQINSLTLSNLFDVYKKLLPFYGEIFVKNKFAYDYLVKSIEAFPNQLELSNKFRCAGFRKIQVFDILGGVAAIHSATK